MKQSVSFEWQVREGLTLLLHTTSATGRSVWGLHYSSIATTATTANTILQTMREEGFTRFLERLQKGGRVQILWDF